MTKISENGPVTYRYEQDTNNEDVIGSFHEQEIVKYDSCVYEIEKILKERKENYL